MEDDRVAAATAVDPDIAVPREHLDAVVAGPAPENDVVEVLEVDTFATIACRQEVVVQRPVGVGVGEVDRVRAAVEVVLAFDRQLDGGVQHHVAHRADAAVATGEFGLAEHGDRTGQCRDLQIVTVEANGDDAHFGERLDLVGRAEAVLIQILPDPEVCPASVGRRQSVVSDVVIEGLERGEVRGCIRHGCGEAQLVASHVAVGRQLDEQPAVVGCQPHGGRGPGAIEVEGDAGRHRHELEPVAVQVERDRRCAGDRPVGDVLVLPVRRNRQLSRLIGELDVAGDRERLQTVRRESVGSDEHRADDRSAQGIVGQAETEVEVFDVEELQGRRRDAPDGSTDGVGQCAGDQRTLTARQDPGRRRVHLTDEGIAAALDVDGPGWTTDELWGAQDCEVAEDGDRVADIVAGERPCARKNAVGRIGGRFQGPGAVVLESVAEGFTFAIGAAVAACCPGAAGSTDDDLGAVDGDRGAEAVTGDGAVAVVEPGLDPTGGSDRTDEDVGGAGVVCRARGADHDVATTTIERRAELVANRTTGEIDPAGVVDIRGHVRIHVLRMRRQRVNVNGTGVAVVAGRTDEQRRVRQMDRRTETIAGLWRGDHLVGRPLGSDLAEQVNARCTGRWAADGCVLGSDVDRGACLLADDGATQFSLKDPPVAQTAQDVGTTGIVVRADVTARCADDQVLAIDGHAGTELVTGSEPGCFDLALQLPQRIAIGIAVGRLVEDEHRAVVAVVGRTEDCGSAGNGHGRTEFGGRQRSGHGECARAPGRSTLAEIVDVLVAVDRRGVADEIEAVGDDFGASSELDLTRLEVGSIYIVGRVELVRAQDNLGTPGNVRDVCPACRGGGGRAGDGHVPAGCLEVVLRCAARREAECRSAGTGRGLRADGVRHRAIGRGGGGRKVVAAGQVVHRRHHMHRVGAGELHVGTPEAVGEEAVRADPPRWALDVAQAGRGDTDRGAGLA